MKKIIILFLLAISINAQSWNSIVTTSISNADKIEDFTNKNGIHLLARTSSNQIKYYLLNSSGSVIRSTQFTSNGNFPNIVGDSDGNKIYATYQDGGYIKTKYSTDAGVSWDQLSSIYVGWNQTLNGMDVVRHDDETHISWTTYNSSTHKHEVFYKRYNGQNQLGAYKNVTDYTSSEVGSFPSITASGNKIYVAYNTSYSNNVYLNEGDVKSRAKNLDTDTWLATESIPHSFNSCIETIFATDTKLYSVSYQTNQPLHYQLTVMSRNLNSSTWGNTHILTSTYSEPFYHPKVVELDNGDLYVFHDYSGVKYNKYDGNNWSGGTVYSASSHLIYTASASTNDIYVIMEGSNTLKYRQFDSPPAKPEVLNSTSYNNHPKLYWNANNEPDINYYRIYKDGSFLGTPSNTYYVDNSETMYFPGGGNIKTYVQYKVKAIDNSNKISNLSNGKSVAVNGSGGGMDKIIGEDITESIIEMYALNSNYPNPFNPTTNISYQIPQDGFVNLVVYNALGQEVAELVNQNQSMGKYRVKFNASNLPSGVYIYKLQAGEFSSVKKMLLTK